MERKELHSYVRDRSSLRPGYFLDAFLEPESSPGLCEINHGTHCIREFRWLLWKELEGVTFNLKGETVDGYALDRNLGQGPRAHLSAPSRYPDLIVDSLDRHRCRFQALALEAPHVDSHSSEETSPTLFN